MDKSGVDFPVELVDRFQWACPRRADTVPCAGLIARNEAVTAAADIKPSRGHCLHHRKSCAGRAVLLEPKAGPLQQRAIFIKAALAARQYHHHEEVKNGAGPWLPDLAQEHLEHDDAASPPHRAAAVFQGCGRIAHRSNHAE